MVPMEKLCPMPPATVNPGSLSFTPDGAGCGHAPLSAPHVPALKSKQQRTRRA